MPKRALLGHSIYFFSLIVSAFLVAKFLPSPWLRGVGVALAILACLPYWRELRMVPVVLITALITVAFPLSILALMGAGSPSAPRLMDYMGAQDLIQLGIPVIFSVLLVGFLRQKSR